MSDPVLYEFHEPGVGVITFNRPERMNAWTPEMGTMYFNYIDQCVADPKVRVIVVTGAGRGYCAGADMDSLQEIESATGADRDPSRAAGDRVQLEITTISKPVIAAVNGACAGLGLVQALMCDIRFAAAGAKFTTAFAKRGLIAEYGVSWILPRLVGPARAMDLLFSSRIVLAEEAQEMGMVNTVVPADQLMEYTMAYAADIARNVSPTSISIMKRQVYGDYNQDLGTAGKTAVELMIKSFGRPDFAEGVSSFVQKRQAEFPSVNPNA